MCMLLPSCNVIGQLTSFERERWQIVYSTSSQQLMRKCPAYEGD